MKIDYRIELLPPLRAILARMQATIADIRKKDGV